MNTSTFEQIVSDRFDQEQWIIIGNLVMTGITLLVNIHQSVKHRHCASICGSSACVYESSKVDK